MPEFGTPKVDDTVKIIENAEREVEHILSEEEILASFKNLVGRIKYKEVQKLRDEKGLYLWTIKIPEVDGSIEYSYARKGKFKEGSPEETVISITYFNHEGIPYYGSTVYKIIDGKWKYTP